MDIKFFARTLITLSLVFSMVFSTWGASLKTVKDFGAKGDGKTDDTAAIQKAVDSGIGDLYFPHGKYRITKTIVLELDAIGPASIIGNGPATILMDGAGPAFRLIGTHQGTANPKTVKNNVWQHQRSPIIKGLEIVGNHPEAIGVQAVETMQPIFTQLTIRKALHGIHLTKRNRNVIISDCHVYENNGIGIYLDQVNLHQINITNSHVSYNKRGGIVVAGSEVRNLHIGTCDIEGNMDAEGDPTANVLLDTRTGSVREGAIVGCTIQHTHNAPNSANIRFIGRSEDLPLKVGNFTISDNVLSDVQINIHLIFARGVTITGNTLWKGFSHNLLVEGSSNIIVGSNLFDRNPDYRPPDSANIVEFKLSSDCNLSGLHINHALKGKAGLHLSNCRYFNITNCTIFDCENGGLLLNDTSHTRVSDCMIDNRRSDMQNQPSIRVTGGEGNMIVNNLVRKLEIQENTAYLEGNRTIH